MIDERALTDARRCPSCAALLTGPDRCPTCGVFLQGETARRLWQVSVEAATLLRKRVTLIDRLRVEAGAAETATVPAGATVPVGPSGPAATPPRRVVHPPEWTRRRVQNLLLALGVLLLTVAAVIFLLVSWGSLGVGGRSAVMAGCTTLAAGGAALAHRRGLGATAESVAVLTVALALLDAYGAHATDLAGLAGVAPLAYWAGALAVLAAAAGLGAAGLPLRALRLTAAVLGQLPIVLLAAHLADHSEHPAAVIAGGLTLQAIAGVAVAATWRFGSSARDALAAVVTGVPVAWVCASVVAAAAAYDEDGSLVAGTSLLLVLAVTAAGVSMLGQPLVQAARPVLLGGAAAVTVLAAWAPPAALVDDQWLPPVLAGIAVLLLAAMLAVPSAWRGPAAAVFLLAAVAPALGVVEEVGVAAVGAISWLLEPWSADAGSSARELVGVGLTWSGGAEVPVVLLAAGAALALAGLVGRAWRVVWPVVPPVLGLALLTAPAALDAGYPVALAGLLAAALVLLAAAPLVVRPTGPAVAGSTLGTGIGLLVLAVAWSFAVDRATLAALPAAVVALLVAALAAERLPGPRGLRVVFVGAAVLTAIGEAAAVARYDGAGWPAVWSLALSLVATAALAGTWTRDRGRRRVMADLAGAAAVADAAALAWWSGASVGGIGLAVTLASAAVLVGAVWGLHRVAPEIAGDLQIVAGAGLAVGVLGSGADADLLWLALLGAGVATGVAAVRRDLHRLGWVSGGLLAASSWVRLMLSDVDAPEAYTVPAGLALVAVGALRRRRDPSYLSWPAYGPGLVLALVPSLLRAVSDPGTARPLLLGLAALVVLGAGLARRLRAPLAIGGVVLGVDALVQLSPFLAELYAAVPRWIAVGAAGLLLLGLGATYERRVQDVRRLQQQLSGLG